MKKVVITLVILGGICAAWVIAFPNSNPFKKWFSKTDDGSTVRARIQLPGRRNGCNYDGKQHGKPVYSKHTAVTKDSRGFRYRLAARGNMSA
jgi:hypothetical protein